MAGNEEIEKGKGKNMEEERGASLEEHLENLTLQGEEEEDLDFSGEFEELIKEVQWLALFRVHTTKAFSHAALFGALRNAWGTAKEVIFKAMEPNLFVVQFQCLGDWNRVMEGRPWLFHGAAVVMEEYDGYSNVKTYKLDKIPIWTRVQGVPEMLMKKKVLAEKVARKVGECIAVLVEDGKINSTPFLIARVWLDLKKPLVRVVPITLKERLMCRVQYEKLPTFCFFGGCIGHEVVECGDGVHPKVKCEWGEWLRVEFMPLAMVKYERGGRGGGRGRGRGRSSGREFEESVEPEAMYDSVDGEDEVEDGMAVEKDEGSKELVLQTALKMDAISPIALQEKKQLRRSDRDGEVNIETTNAKSALSFEESDPARSSSTLQITCQQP